MNLRLYSADDYLQRWNAQFGWDDVAVVEPRAVDVAKILELLVTKRIPRRTLARAIGINPSFLSKLLNGKKPWPAGLRKVRRTGSPPRQPLSHPRGSRFRP